MKEKSVIVILLSRVGGYGGNLFVWCMKTNDLTRSFRHFVKFTQNEDFLKNCEDIPPQNSDFWDMDKRLEQDIDTGPL